MRNSRKKSNTKELVKLSHGGRRIRRSLKRRSVRRNSIKRRSVRRNSVKRRSVRRRSIRRRNSVKRRRVRRGNLLISGGGKYTLDNPKFREDEDNWINEMNSRYSNGLDANTIISLGDQKPGVERPLGTGMTKVNQILSFMEDNTRKATVNKLQEQICETSGDIKGNWIHSPFGSTSDCWGGDCKELEEDFIIRCIKYYKTRANASQLGIRKTTGQVTSNGPADTFSGRYTDN